MAGAIATLLTGATAIPKTGTGLRGQNRHAYDELIDLQSASDPTLAAPYVAASGNSVVSATTNASSGNFTLTINFPNYGVAVTTGNIAYNATAATIQTAIDSALSGETIVASYNAGDVDAAVTGNISANAATITANGTTVNGAHMVITTANVDLDAYEMTVTAGTVGTPNRPAEAVLAAFSIITPASGIVGYGLTPTDGQYVTGDNPKSISPGLKDLLVREVEVNEDGTIGAFFRALVGCV